ncbi:MFS transporter [Catelliglobosispora koreensis]|uniref:MFS transporter n=1 Tax=Catelliglobosispora koreensis TaxID=129052 RepID=UPI00036AB75F|nr:MFS transporter [Catelliglobosispora koreensis]
MYLASVTRPAASGTATKIVAGNVVALGTVSLITDISSEMVSAVLPLYLVLSLQLSPLSYGLLDGIYTGATAILRIVGGFVADKFRHRKLVAGLGYGLSALAKLGLLLAGRSTGALGFVIATDRMGKGLRTAPRDALITLSTPEGALGRAFGVHRMMDSVGAFLGPLVAMAVLTVAAQSYDAVFVTSFCIAALGVVVLVLFVHDRRGTLAAQPIRLKDAARIPGLGKLALVAVLLGLATIGDGFLFLLLQKRDDLSLIWFPLLAVGTSLAYLVLATPIGALADRIGRVPVFLAGYAVLTVTYLLLASGASAWLILVLYGLFYACTDGILMALAGPVLPEHLRTTGIAVIQTGQAVAYLGSSVLFGLAWQTIGSTPAIFAAALTAVIALAATALVLRRFAATTPAVAAEDR